VLDAPHLAVYDDLKTLFDKRDEVFENVNAETRKFTTEVLLGRLLDADIWCAEVKDIRRAAEDPQAKHMGMITHYHEVVAADRLIPGALELAEMIAAGSPAAVLKRLIAAAGRAVDLPGGLALEREIQGGLYRSETGQARIKAFAEKSQARGDRK
jgi:hypothetical protein